MGIGETREELNFVFSGTFQDRCRASAWARSLADEFTLTPTSQLYSAKRISCVAENRTFPFGVDKRAFSCIFLLDLGISLCQHATMRIALPRTLPSCLFLSACFRRPEPRSSYRSCVQTITTCLHWDLTPTQAKLRPRPSAYFKRRVPNLYPTGIGRSLPPRRTKAWAGLIPPSAHCLMRRPNSKLH